MSRLAFLTILAFLTAFASLADTIRLKNGRTIRADTVREVGDLIEFTIGEGTYRVAKNAVQEIVRDETPVYPGSPGNGVGSSSDTSDHARGNALSYPVEDPKQWHLYESTGQIREECRTGEFARRVHPEFQSKSFPVSKDEQEMTCASLNLDMGSEYESLVDRGVELQKELCTAGNGRVPNSRPQGFRLAASWDEMMHIVQELSRRMKQVENSEAADDKRRVQRIMIDSYRLAGTCGHGMG
jgi:hypothetical protein